MGVELRLNQAWSGLGGAGLGRVGAWPWATWGPSLQANVLMQLLSSCIDSPSYSFLFFPMPLQAVKGGYVAAPMRMQAAQTACHPSLPPSPHPIPAAACSSLQHRLLPALRELAWCTKKRMMCVAAFCSLQLRQAGSKVLQSAAHPSLQLACVGAGTPDKQQGSRQEGRAGLAALIAANQTQHPNTNA